MSSSQSSRKQRESRKDEGGNRTRQSSDIVGKSLNDEDEFDVDAGRKDKKERRRKSSGSKKSRSDSLLERSDPSDFQHTEASQSAVGYVPVSGPEMSTSQGGLGLAAEYYGDTGESVAQQPGLRTHSPSLIVGAEPHLQPASSEAAPPIEPSQIGGTGAAASFYSQNLNDDYTSTLDQHTTSNYSTAPSRPSQTHHSASAPVVNTLGAIAAGAATGYVLSSGKPSQSDHSHTSSTSNYAATQSLPSKPSKPSKPSTYATPSSGYMAAAGGAAFASGLHTHNDQNTTQYSHSAHGHVNADNDQRHRHVGPVHALVNFVKDPDAVAQYEEYTEYIGVCRGCFDRNSTSRDAPRKHRHGSRRSKERRTGSARVDKTQRYSSSSDEEGRRSKETSFIGAGLAGFGLAKVSEALFTRKNDFDDTSDVKSGRFSPPERRKVSQRSRERVSQPDDLASRRRPESKVEIPSQASVSYISHSSKQKSYERKPDQATFVEINRPRDHTRRRKSSSPPAESYVASLSRTDSDRGRRKQDQDLKKRKKKDKGFFSFLSASSSSSSEDLSRLSDNRKRERRNRSKDRINSNSEAQAALVGLGAATAALALKDTRGDRSKQKDRLPSKVTSSDSHRLTTAHQRQSHTNDPEEVWESATEEDQDEYDAELAFGSPVRRASFSSIDSQSSGTDKWGWRWGGKDRKRRRSSLENATQHSSRSGSIDMAAIRKEDSFPPEYSVGTGDRKGRNESLQYVVPVATSDPGRFEAHLEGTLASPGRATLVSTRKDLDIEQPQPVVPVLPHVYESQASRDSLHGAAKLSEAANVQTQPDAYYISPSHDNEFGLRDEVGRKEVDETRKLQRRKTSPARFGDDAGLASIISQKSRTSDRDPSSVKFAVSEEQEETERRERRRRRRESKSERSRRDSLPDETGKDSKSTVGSRQTTERDTKRAEDGATAAKIAGIVGATAGVAAIVDKMDQKETREERRERRRQERQREDEEDNVTKSERRRKKDREKYRATNGDDIPIYDLPKAYEAETSRDHVDVVSGKSQKSQSVWQEAAASKRAIHEDYGSFFAPEEVIGHPKAEQVDPDSSHIDDDGNARRPSIVEITPRITMGPDEPVFSPADDGSERVDPSSLALPWDVPRLKLVQPTPPVSRASTPFFEPVERFEREETTREQDISSVSAKDESIDGQYQPKDDQPSSLPNETWRNPPATDSDAGVDKSWEPSSTAKPSIDDDVEFAATLAASAQDAGFDPSVVIDNPNYRRRDSPPGSLAEDDLQDFAPRRKKDKKKRKNASAGQDPGGIESDVREQSSQRDLNRGLENDGIGTYPAAGEGFAVSSSENARTAHDSPVNPAKVNGNGDYNDVPEEKAEIADSGYPAAEKSGKRKKKSKRHDSIPSRQSGVQLTEDGSRPEKANGDLVETGRDTQDRQPEDQKALITRSLPLDSLESGHVKYRDEDMSDPLDLTDQPSESFLGERPEPSRPPDLPPDNVDVMSTPGGSPKTRTRRPSSIMIASQDPGGRGFQSPTAVPVHFRRPQASPGSSRSLSQSPLAQSIAEARPKLKPRPRSTEFKASKEMRPLWLVERHQSHHEPDEGIIYPPLPESQSTSAASSVLDPDDLDAEFQAEEKFFEVHRDSSEQPKDLGDLLGSEEPTPTVASFPVIEHESDSTFNIRNPVIAQPEDGSSNTKEAALHVLRSPSEARHKDREDQREETSLSFDAKGHESSSLPDAISSPSLRYEEQSTQVPAEAAASPKKGIGGEDHISGGMPPDMQPSQSPLPFDREPHRISRDMSPDALLATMVSAAESHKDSNLGVTKDNSKRGWPHGQLDDVDESFLPFDRQAESTEARQEEEPLTYASPESRHIVTVDPNMSEHDPPEKLAKEPLTSGNPESVAFIPDSAQRTSIKSLQDGHDDLLIQPASESRDLSDISKTPATGSGAAIPAVSTEDTKGSQMSRKKSKKGKKDKRSTQPKNSDDLREQPAADDIFRPSIPSEDTVDRSEPPPLPTSRVADPSPGASISMSDFPHTSEVYPTTTSQDLPTKLEHQTPTTPEAGIRDRYRVTDSTGVPQSLTDDTQARHSEDADDQNKEKIEMLTESTGAPAQEAVLAKDDDPITPAMDSKLEISPTQPSPQITPDDEFQQPIAEHEIEPLSGQSALFSTKDEEGKADGVFDAAYQTPEHEIPETIVTTALQVLIADEQLPTSLPAEDESMAIYGDKVAISDQIERHDHSEAKLQDEQSRRLDDIATSVSREPSAGPESPVEAETIISEQTDEPIHETDSGERDMHANAPIPGIYLGEPLQDELSLIHEPSTDLDKNRLFDSSVPSDFIPAEATVSDSHLPGSNLVEEPQQTEGPGSGDGVILPEKAPSVEPTIKDASSIEEGPFAVVSAEQSIAPSLSKKDKKKRKQSKSVTFDVEGEDVGDIEGPRDTPTDETPSDPLFSVNKDKFETSRQVEDQKKQLTSEAPDLDAMTRRDDDQAIPAVSNDIEADPTVPIRTDDIQTTSKKEKKKKKKSKGIVYDLGEETTSDNAVLIEEPSSATDRISQEGTSFDNDISTLDDTSSKKDKKKRKKSKGGVLDLDEKRFDDLARSEEPSTTTEIPAQDETIFQDDTIPFENSSSKKDKKKKKKPKGILSDHGEEQVAEDIGASNGLQVASETFAPDETALRDHTAPLDDASLVEDEAKKEHETKGVILELGDEQIVEIAEPSQEPPIASDIPVQEETLLQDDLVSLDNAGSKKDKKKKKKGSKGVVLDLDEEQFGQSLVPTEQPSEAVESIPENRSISKKEKKKSKSKGVVFDLGEEPVGESVMPIESSLQDAEGLQAETTTKQDKKKKKSKGVPFRLDTEDVITDIVPTEEPTREIVSRPQDELIPQMEEGNKESEIEVQVPGEVDSDTHIAPIGGEPLPEAEASPQRDLVPVKDKKKKKKKSKGVKFNLNAEEIKDDAVPAGELGAIDNKEIPSTFEDQIDIAPEDFPPPSNKKSKKKKNKKVSLDVFETPEGPAEDQGTAINESSDAEVFKGRSNNLSEDLPEQFSEQDRPWTDAVEAPIEATKQGEDLQHAETASLENDLSLPTASAAAADDIDTPDLITNQSIEEGSAVDSFVPMDAQTRSEHEDLDPLSKTRTSPSSEAIAGTLEMQPSHESSPLLAEQVNDNGIPVMPDVVSDQHQDFAIRPEIEESGPFTLSSTTQDDSGQKDAQSREANRSLEEQNPLGQALDSQSEDQAIADLRDIPTHSSELETTPDLDLQQGMRDSALTGQPSPDSRAALGKSFADDSTLDSIAHKATNEHEEALGNTPSLSFEATTYPTDTTTSEESWQNKANVTSAPLGHHGDVPSESGSLIGDKTSQQDFVTPEASIDMTRHLPHSTDTPLSAGSIDLLDAEQQRQYDEEYARELQRHLAAGSDDERHPADSHNDHADQTEDHSRTAADDSISLEQYQDPSRSPIFPVPNEEGSQQDVSITLSKPDLDQVFDAFPTKGTKSKKKKQQTGAEAQSDMDDVSNTKAAATSDIRGVETHEQHDELAATLGASSPPPDPRRETDYFDFEPSKADDLGTHPPLPFDPHENASNDPIDTNEPSSRGEPIDLGDDDGADDVVTRTKMSRKDSKKSKKKNKKKSLLTEYPITAEGQALSTSKHDLSGIAVVATPPTDELQSPKQLAEPLQERFSPADVASGSETAPEHKLDTNEASGQQLDLQSSKSLDENEEATRPEDISSRPWEGTANATTEDDVIDSYSHSGDRRESLTAGEDNDSYGGILSQYEALDSTRTPSSLKKELGIVPPFEPLKEDEVVAEGSLGSRRSRRQSGAVYDSDDSEDSGFDIQKRRRRMESIAEERKPSPVNSTSKDRSSALFESSPSRNETSGPGPLPHADEHNRDMSDDKNAHIEPSWSFGQLNSADDLPQQSLFGGPSTSDRAERALHAKRTSTGDGPQEAKIKARRTSGTEFPNSQELPGPTLKPLSTHFEETGRRDLSGSEGEQTIGKKGGRRASQQSAGSAAHSIESIHAHIRTPDRINSPSGQSFRSTGTPPLRRVDHSVSSDLRAASRRSSGAGILSPPAALDEEDDARRRASRKITGGSGLESLHEMDDQHNTFLASSSTYNPLTDKGKSRARADVDMADYEGWGDVRGQSPISPTRPPSLRKLQSMQFSEMEQRLAILASENNLLQTSKLKAERRLHEQEDDHSQLRQNYEEALQEQKSYVAERDGTVRELNTIIDALREEVAHLTETQAELTRSRELDVQAHHLQLSAHHQEDVEKQLDALRTEKARETEGLRRELDNAKEQVRRLQQQIQAAISSEDVVVHDEDYFDNQCQDLFKHLTSWVTRFSKLSDTQRCYLAGEMRNPAHRDLFEDTMLDGSEVDDYLQDRHRRRDVFMSVTMTLMFKHIFARYLFGMDREHRQKLKTLDNTLQEVGPPSAVHKWRATTLTLLSKRPAFQSQRDTESAGVLDDIWATLSTALPPSSGPQAEQCRESLRRIINLAADLSIDMRLQRAEYSMLPPPEAEFDPETGDIKNRLYFLSTSMNDRSSANHSNEELENREAVLRIVLFPLVIKNTDEGDRIVVSPAQVHVAPIKKGKTVRVMSVADNRSDDASFADGEDTVMEGGMF